MTASKGLRRLGTLLLILVAAGTWVTCDLYEQLCLPLPLDSPVRMQIMEGERLRDALRSLQDRGVLQETRQLFYLEIYARASGTASAIKAGEYDIVPGMSALDVLRLWLSGKTVLYDLRIVEGMTFAQALQLVLAHPMLKKTLHVTTPEAVMTALGHPDQHPEGRFFPDTYRFARDTTDVAFLQRAHAAMERAMAEEWAQRAPDLPYENPDEALIMASIVEKETGLAEERAQIAGVFVRRLQQGMRLQTDPTVIYGVGAAFDGNLRRRHLDADGPYNTYLRAGLPPTPICLPGRAALHAALHPAPGDAMFFVSRGDGSHQFSATLAEHEAAVRRYQLQRP